MTTGGRLPDFVIIGRQKSGTSTLGRWLGEQPEISLSRVEEPAFFDQDHNWERGLEWYTSLFERAQPGQVVGEGSPGYTGPRRAPIAAARMADVIPHARLVCLLRHPVERIRSEYRHRRIMGDEARGFIDALRDPGWHYLRQSMYHLCLAPFFEHFAREQILVVRTEDLAKDAWVSVLGHIGLDVRPPPAQSHNVSAERGLHPRVIHMRRNVEFRRRLAWLPGPVKRLPAALLRRRGPAFDEMLADSKRPVPPELLTEMWEDIARLEAWLGVTQLWPRDV